MLSVLGTHGWHQGLFMPCQALELKEGQWDAWLCAPVRADGVEGCGYQWLSQRCHTSTHQPLLNPPCLSAGPGSGGITHPVGPWPRPAQDTGISFKPIAGAW